MSALQRTAATTLALLLLLIGYGLWATRTPPPTTARPTQPPAATGTAATPDAMPVIDQQTYLTAQRLAHLPNTPEELPLAQQAVELADHELDLAFTAAMRHL
jgi:hypothetical protein